MKLHDYSHFILLFFMGYQIEFLVWYKIYAQHNQKVHSDLCIKRFTKHFWNVFRIVMEAFYCHPCIRLIRLYKVWRKKRSVFTRMSVDYFMMMKLHLQEMQCELSGWVHWWFGLIYSIFKFLPYLAILNPIVSSIWFDFGICDSWVIFYVVIILILYA